MPVILNKKGVDNWINIENKSFEIQKVISQTAESLEHYQVSNFVNSPKNNSKRCITPFKETIDLNLLNNE
jgi:putative SOS response-associated peptidase YedK